MQHNFDELPTRQLQPADSPDFSWPYRVTEGLFERLSELWNDIQDAISSNPVSRWLAEAIGLLVILYVLLVWVSICYVTFPISPFGFWDIAKWLLIAGSLVWGTVGLALGLATVACVIFLIVYVFILFLLSLSFLGWMIWRAFIEQLPWIHGYYKVIIAGLLLVLGLATFVEGSNRYWSEPFDSTEWGRLTLIGLSGWSALFCHLMRTSTSGQKTSHRIIKWTVILTIAVGAFEYWQVDKGREEYFLVKGVREHPSDATSWLNLGWRNYFQGYELESEPGDENHSPPDPRPSFAEALRCFNRAISLGDRQFDTYAARAEMADKLTKREESILFAQEALQSAGSDSFSSENARQIKTLNEIIARNAAQPTPQQIHEQTVRAERLRTVPEMARWVFEFLL